MTDDNIILVDFYKSHNMPKLSVIDKKDSTTEELTIEHIGFMDHAITIDHSNKKASERLKEIEWIQNNPIVSVDANGKQIDYYKLTRKALNIIVDK